MLKRSSLPLLFFLLTFCSLIPVLHAEEGAASAARKNFQSGLAYERLGRLDEAYTQLQVAANLDPESAEVALALGIVATRLQLWDEALRALEKSIMIDANSCASYFQLAFLYEKKGLKDRATESWQRFYQLTTDPALKTMAQKHIDFLEKVRG